MTQTNGEALARAEFWAMEAMECYGSDSRQRKLLNDAYGLIRKASEVEKQEARQRVLKAAQIGW